MSHSSSEAIPLVVVCLTGAKGGIDRVIEQWLGHAVSGRFKIYLICRDVGGILDEVDGGKLVERVRLPFPKGRPTLLSELQAVLVIGKILKRLGRAVVNLHDYYAIQAAMPAWMTVARRMPVVATVHMHTSWIPGDFRAKRILALSEHQVLKRAEAIIAVSEDYSYRLAGLGYPSDRIHTVHNGIDCAAFDPERFERGEARTYWGIPGDRVALGFAGRFALQKRPVELIRAVALLDPPERRRLLLLFAGRGPLENDMRREISVHGLGETIRIVGHVDEVRQFYGALDALILSSSMEGLPMTALEAMAQRVPVLATKVGGNAEIITDGVDGWLAEDWRPETLAAGIRRVLCDLPRIGHMGIACRRKIEGDFSIAKTVLETEHILISAWNSRRLS